MKYFVENGTVKRVIIRLDTGDMLLESIEQVIKEAGIRDGAVVSGIGTLSDTRIHMVTTTTYPAVEVFPEWKDVPMEVSSISGIIADGIPHLHMVFSNPKKTFSGHLEHGCKTLYLCEIVIELFDGIHLYRKRNDRGIMELEEYSQK